MPAGKLSSALLRRLDALPPDRRVRVIVKLGLSGPPLSVEEYTNDHSRAEALAKRSTMASGLLAPIDGVLRRHGGKRLQDAPNVLGTLAVETTPSGVRALASLDNVKTVFEDQKINSIG